MSALEEKVLVVTGGFLTSGETNAWRAIRKQAVQWRSSDEAWLDLKVKLVAAEPILLARARRSTAPEARDYLAHRENVETPELTEALLATLLHAEGVPYALGTTDEALAGALDERLEETTCVFLSSTMLRDCSELDPLVARLRRPHNRVVVGGALASILAEAREEVPGVDVLAVGYGESLVPALVAWMRNGYGRLEAPEGGRLEEAGATRILHGALPPGGSLDHLPPADWSLSARDRGRRYEMVHYESVRGCPYRCAFCNYPYLFSDERFRMRSAQRIADDWARYVDELGVRYVNCLDSLFTMPKRRLVELCELLLERGIRVEWICYARADDLADEDVVRLMRRAGARLVHVGIESGDQGQLDRMAKRVRVEDNAAALRNCRRHGLTTLASLIVGYPGETEATLDATLRFLRETPPDFHYLAVFNARVERVPVLAPESRARFGLDTAPGGRTGAPYWSHDTMDCLQACNHARRLERALALERISLNAATFYDGLLHFAPRHREALLDLQEEATRRGGWRLRALGLANRLVDGRLRRVLATHPALARRTAGVGA